MHKILIDHPVVGSYSFFLFSGILCGYLLSRFRSKRFGLDGCHIDNVALLGAVAGLFGARLFSWLFYFPPGVSLWRAFLEPGGGMVFYGGVVVGLAAVVSYSIARRVSLLKLLDVLAPGLILGLAIGRIGCFMAGCCWGDLCEDRGSIAKITGPGALWQIQTVPAISRASFPLAVHFPPDSGAYEQHVRLGLIDGNAARSLAVHPVQLYEAALGLLLCVVLSKISPVTRRPGEVINLMFVGYAAIRFTTEFVRADNAPKYFGLTLSQVISVCLAVGSILFLIWSRFLREAPSSSETQPTKELLPAFSMQNTK